MRIVIIGAGPAGLAAGVAAGRSGARVVMVDDNPAPGGQIWRGEERGWTAKLRDAGVAFLSEARVIAGGTGELLIEREEQVTTLPFDKLILAAGARELFLPFPGWTLPGVMGAGGLQALVKSGLDVAGKRIVVSGTGPLLLAVAAYLRAHGATVPLIAEQTTWSKLLRFGAQLPWSKHREALRLWSSTYSPGMWVSAAEGRNHLQQVTVTNGASNRKVECDYLACGFGLVPNIELANLLECDPATLDEFQESNAPGVYCAGEMTGIGGADLAMVEGTIAGHAAAGNKEAARAQFPARDRWRAFAGRLNEAFALRPELKQLPQADTVVCRCEDVTLGQLSGQPSWRAAKLQRRCGMGPCQGRVCGPATRFLFGWQPESVRPPIFPARVASLMQSNSNPTKDDD